MPSSDHRIIINLKKNKLIKESQFNNDSLKESLLIYYTSSYTSLWPLMIMTKSMS